MRTRVIGKSFGIFFVRCSDHNSIEYPPSYRRWWELMVFLIHEDTGLLINFALEDYIDIQFAILRYDSFNHCTERKNAYAQSSFFEGQCHNAFRPLRESEHISFIQEVRRYTCRSRLNFSYLFIFWHGPGTHCFKFHGKSHKGRTTSYVHPTHGIQVQHQRWFCRPHTGWAYARNVIRSLILYHGAHSHWSKIHSRDIHEIRQITRTSVPGSFGNKFGNGPIFHGTRGRDGGEDRFWTVCCTNIAYIRTRILHDLRFLKLSDHENWRDIKTQQQQITIHGNRVLVRKFLRPLHTTVCAPVIKKAPSMINYIVRGDITSL